MKKRILSLFCILALCMMLLPVSALAVGESYDLWINNVQVTSDNAADVLGQADGERATVSYDVDSNTLTLNGATLTEHYTTAGGSWPAVICSTDASQPLIIQIQGTNTITSADAIGIGAYGDVQLTGPGSLTIQTENQTALTGANVTIDSGTYHLTSIKMNSIYSSNSVALSGSANITATGFYGIVGGTSVSVSGNAVVDTSSTDDCGIYTDGTLTISDKANVTATGGQYQGLSARGPIQINGGTVTATASQEAAVYANGSDITINGGAVVLFQTTAAEGAALVAGNSSVSGDVTIDGSANVTLKTVDGDGIFSWGNVTITGGATVEDAPIYAEGTIDITGGAKVKASAPATAQSAIRAVGQLTISGSDTEVNATSSAENYAAVMSNTGMTISEGAQVVAIGEQNAGIYCKGPSAAISISGEKTNVFASNGSDSSSAVLGESEISITDGAQVEAVGAGAGIYTSSADEKISISNSVVQVNLDNPDQQWGIYAQAEADVSDAWVDTTTYNNISQTTTDSVVFIGNEGQVYGNVTVPGNVEIQQDKTLTVPENTSLTIPDGVKLENNGTLSYEGTINTQGSVEGTGTIEQPENDTLNYVVELVSDGTVLKRALIAQNVGSFTLPAAPQKDGYTFAGWQSSIDGQRYESNETATITAQTTFTAKWVRNPSSGGESIYPISVNSTAGGTVESSHHSAAEGTKVTLTVIPNEGYELVALTAVDENNNQITVTDQGDGTLYSFQMPGSKVAVTVNFQEKVTEPEELPFTDVETDDWFYDAVEYVYSNNLMEGTSATTFAPMMNTNRSMIVTILHRLEGEPQVDYVMNFGDVEGGTWYTEAVRWAASEGIVKGYSNTVFAPDDTMTREQLAVILYRYAQYKGYDVTVSNDLSGFTDGNTTSSWAMEAMKWAVGSDLLSGKGNGTLDPQGTATRAEMATILMRFMELTASL